MRWAEFKQIIDLATKAYKASSEDSEVLMRVYKKRAKEILRSSASSTASKSAKEIYESAASYADMANKSVRAFQERMAMEINSSYGQKHSLNAPLPDNHQAESIIETYHHLLAKEEEEKVASIAYPHRSYDPNIRLGQLAYIPISYTLKKIAKLFIDYFKPYKGDYQLIEDFKQPRNGIVNTVMGLVKIVAGIFTLNIFRVGDGFFTSLRGVIELATTPFAWFVKPLTRAVISLFFDEPKIEEDRDIQKLLELGEHLLNEQNDDDDFSLVKMQALLGLCNDLHRKYDKGQQRERLSDIDEQKEKQSITELRDINQTLTRQKFSDYFSLFGGRKNNFSDAEDKDLDFTPPKTP